MPSVPPLISPEPLHRSHRGNAPPAGKFAAADGDAVAAFGVAEEMHPLREKANGAAGATAAAAGAAEELPPPRVKVTGSAGAAVAAATGGTAEGEGSCLVLDSSLSEARAKKGRRQDLVH